MPVLDVYVRASKKRRHDERYQNIEGQEAVCLRRVTEVGTLGEVWRDRGLSAWNPAIVRPGWNALMERLSSGNADGVVVFDLERFSRQPIDGERLISMAGRGLVIIDADGMMDLSTASGKKAFRDGMAAAAYYSDKLRDRTTRGKELRAREGKPNGSSRPFGFEADGVTVRPDEASALLCAAQMYVAGETLDRLIAEMDSRGLPTSYGLPWTRTGVRRLLVRPRNAGHVVYRGSIVEGVSLPGEPVLPAGLFARVLAVAAGRKPSRPPSSRYLLSGVARCVFCGAGLTGRPRGQLPPYEEEIDGSVVRRQYWCAPSAGGSNCVSIDQRWLDGYVGDWTVRTLSDPSFASNVAAMDLARETERSGILAEIASIDADIMACAERVGDGSMSLREHLAITSPLRLRVSGLRERVAAIEFVNTPPDVSGLRLLDLPEIGILSEWESGTTGSRRGMVTRALAGRRLIVGAGMPSRFDPSRVTVV